MSDRHEIPSPSECTLDVFCTYARPLARNIVGAFNKKIGDPDLKKDIEAAAWRSVIETYKAYDPARSDSVRPYLIRNINLAMREELSVENAKGRMKPRMWRRKMELDKWVAEFEVLLDRKPTVKEIREGYGQHGEDTIRGLITAEAEYDEELEAPTEDPADLAEGKDTVRLALEAANEKGNPRDAEVFVSGAVDGEKGLEREGAQKELTFERCSQIYRRLMAAVRKAVGAT